MKREDWEKLLSAFVDGELGASERSALEQVLATEPAAGASLAELQQLSALLRDLPSAPAPERLKSRILHRLRKIAHRRRLTPGALLNAYIDDELPPSARRKVEERFLAHPGYRQKLDEYRDVSALLAGMPTESAPTDFADRLLDRLEAEPASARSASPAGNLSIRNLLADLPRENAPANALANVLARIEAESAPAFADRPTIARPLRHPGNGWVAVLASLAASVMILVGVPDVQRALTKWFGPGDARQASLPPRAADPSAPHEPILTASDDGPTVGPVPAPNEGVPVAEPGPDRRRSKPAEEVFVLEDAPLLPLGRTLQTIRPGQMVKLDGQRMEFVCVDVERAFDRLRIILMDNNVQMSAVVPEEGVAENDGPKAGGVYLVEVSTSPDQLGDILSDLWFAERQDTLIAKSDVKPADPGEIERVEQTTPDVRRLRASSTVFVRPTERMETPGKSGKVSKSAIALAPTPAGKVEKPAATATVAEPKVAESKPERRPKDPQVRVVFVLTPMKPGDAIRHMTDGA